MRLGKRSGIVCVVLTLLLTACASTPSNPFSSWEIIVEPFDWTANFSALGRTDRAFQGDLIRELTGARNVPARWADSEAGSLAPRALHLTGRLRSGRTENLVIQLRREPSREIIWTNEYIIRASGAAGDTRQQIIETIARDVAQVVRAVEAGPPTPPL